MITEEYSLFQKTNKTAVDIKTVNFCLGKIADQKIGKIKSPLKSDSFPVNVLWNTALRKKSLIINRTRKKIKSGETRCFRRSYILWRLRFLLILIMQFGNPKTTAVAKTIFTIFMGILFKIAKV